MVGLSPNTLGAIGGPSAPLCCRPGTRPPRTSPAVFGQGGEGRAGNSQSVRLPFLPPLLFHSPSVPQLRAPRAPAARAVNIKTGFVSASKGPRATASSAWQPQKCRGLAWPGGSVVPLPPLLSFFFCGVGVWGAQAQPCSAHWVFVTSRNGATAPGKHPGGNFGGQTPAVPPAEPPPVAGTHTHTPALAPRGAAAAVPAWLQPFQPEQSPKAVSKGSCSASAPSFPFSVLSGAIIDVNSPVKGHCQREKGPRPSSGSWEQGDGAGLRDIVAHGPFP